MIVRFTACIVFASATLILAAAGWSAGPLETNRAFACTPAFFTFDEHVQQAAFVGIVETTSVGDGVIREPRLPTSTPLPEDSPVPIETPTPTNSQAAESPVPTTDPALWYAGELTGLSAHAVVLELIGGDAFAEIDIDMETRRSYERSIRLREASHGAPVGCGFVPLTYEPAKRYVVVLERYVTPSLATVRRFPIVGSDVLFAENDLILSESAYRRYFPNVPADLRDWGDNSGRRLATVAADRLPLSEFMAMLKAMRTAIAPPDTGSAGLAANR